MTNLVLLTAAEQRPSELEQRVLGALLEVGVPLRPFLDASGVSERELQDTRVRLAWSVLRSLVLAGRPVSAVSVFAAGRAARLLDDSDAQWLQDLHLNNTVSAEALPGLLESLRAQQRATQLQALVGRLRQTVSEGGLDLAERVAPMLADAQRLVTTSAEGSALQSILDLLAERERHARENTTALVSTGLSALDGLIGGGIPEKALVLLTGDPGSGKTGVEASMIRGLLESSSARKVGVVGLEDGIGWIAKRWLAEETGLALSEVGWKKLGDDSAVHDAAERLSPLLERVLVASGRRMSTHQVLRLAGGWKRDHDISALFIDNHSQFDFSGGEKFAPRWEAVERSVEDLRAWAEDNRCPVVLLVHTTEPDGPARRRPGPPRPAGMRGGRALDQKARLMLGTWVKGDAWRLTVLKGNELRGVGKTLELARIPHAGLVKRDGGVEVNLAEEERAERLSQARERESERDKRTAERKAAAKAEKAAKEEAAKPPQGTLL